MMLRVWWKRSQVCWCWKLVSEEKNVNISVAGKALVLIVGSW